MSWDISGYVSSLETNSAFVIDVTGSTPERASQGPISRLPPELLHQIFPYCVPSRVAPSISRPPLTLGFVCRSWRESSIRCHALWNSLSIGANPCFRRESCIAGVELWLSRSGNLPLTIQFRPSESLLLRIHDGILQIICSYVNRWSIVSLQTNMASDRLESLLSTGTPMLKEFTISHFTDPLEHDRSSALDLTHAHNLERLTFSSGPSFRATPPSGLKHLHIQRKIPVDYALALFQHCQMLEYAHLSPTSSNDVPSSFSILTASLKELVISDEGGAGMLLDHVTFPLLSITKLLCVMDDQDHSWTHLSTALRRSQADLRHLTIAHGFHSEDEVVECLKLSPNLTNFVLASFIRDQPISCIFTHLTRNNPLICASLKYLEIIDLDIDISPEMVSQFLQNRWLNVDSSVSSQGRFKQLNLKHHHSNNGFELYNTNPVIQQCLKEGLIFTVGSWGSVYSLQHSTASIYFPNYIHATHCGTPCLLWFIIMISWTMCTYIVKSILFLYEILLATRNTATLSTVPIH